MGRLESNKEWNEIKTNDSWAIFKIMAEFVEGFSEGFNRTVASGKLLVFEPVGGSG